MKLKQISSWISYHEMNDELHNKYIKSWLQEDGPITKRIKSSEAFKLNLLMDEIDEVEDSEADFLGENLGMIKTREVILMGNEEPKVFARSLIPLITIEKGFAKLGELGTKPLGDILFEKEIFKRTKIVFAKFRNDKKLFWGRKSKYIVNNHPLSVMEVFLIDADE
tara:strand:+ start:427 stop:924 length:498 start_codon:yes stop_codon:yes gene_type:complete